MGGRGQVSPDLEDYVDGLKHLEISVRRKRLVDLYAKHLWRHKLKTWDSVLVAVELARVPWHEILNIRQWQLQEIKTTTRTR